MWSKCVGTPCWANHCFHHIVDGSPAGSLPMKPFNTEIHHKSLYPKIDIQQILQKSPWLSALAWISCSPQVEHLIDWVRVVRATGDSGTASAQVIGTGFQARPAPLTCQMSLWEPKCLWCASDGSWNWSLLQDGARLQDRDERERDFQNYLDR